MDEQKNIEVTYPLNMEGAKFVKDLLAYTATKGGFPIELYGTVAGFHQDLVKFISDNTPKEIEEAEIVTE